MKTKILYSKRFTYAKPEWVGLIKAGTLGAAVMLSLASTASMASTEADSTSTAVTGAKSPANMATKARDMPAQSHVTSTDVTAIQAHIRRTLTEAGIKPAILSIVPSELPSMYQVNLQGMPPLHITADGRHALQGTLQPNPSPKLTIVPSEPASQSQVGMPVSDELRQSMLKNMSMLENMSAQIPLYHTSIPGLIWGMTVDETPFITTTDASVFTDGEIFTIEDGQINELDENFERQKNRQIFAQLDEQELIIYPATTAQRAVVYVATDINCPYCRRFHKLIPKLNAKGITIKVIGFPVYEESFEPMRQIWCKTESTARKQALDAAMTGQKVANTCSAVQGEEDKTNNLLANQLKAKGLVVIATPMIFREDGTPYQASFESAEFLEFLHVN
ncbi:thioredoxin fold domain-containing protein [Psychrobacter pygoscelis]|uniref:thioredoxin fold domain-containing protein n=1 Tax=Psychrobacter pygoscelis TaxID=2488563 RepID=UPI0010386EE9|nr:thioredoxin fold domain-containing protein [Psychrobacter pygoscelis]